MQQERSANQKLNEEIRILLRENISLKTDNHHLNEKIKELESTLKSYQKPGEWFKPKKTVTWENPLLHLPPGKNLTQTNLTHLLILTF